jgi:uncharacterized membrane-anchored protein YitT (DUF2179 family)
MRLLQKVTAVLAGSVLVAVGVNLFLVPHRLMDGGMIGIGLLAKYYLQVPPGLIMILVSIPVYTIVFRCDRALFFNSFHGMLFSSLCIDVLSPLREWNDYSTAVSAVVGGALIGIGIGLMLAYDTNTGGTDLLAQFLAKRYDLPVALLIFLIDGVIVVASIEAIGPARSVFSLVTIVAVAIFTHYVSGFRRRRPPYIVVRPLRR